MRAIQTRLQSFFVHLYIDWEDLRRLWKDGVSQTEVIYQWRVQRARRKLEQKPAPKSGNDYPDDCCF